MPRGEGGASLKRGATSPAQGTRTSQSKEREAKEEHPKHEEPLEEPQVPSEEEEGEEGDPTFEGDDADDDEEEGEEEEPDLEEEPEEEDEPPPEPVTPQKRRKPTLQAARAATGKRAALPPKKEGISEEASPSIAHPGAPPSPPSTPRVRPLPKLDPHHPHTFLRGHAFAFLGTLTTSRDAWTQLIEEHGGRVVSTPSAKTSFAVVGKAPGRGKMQKVEALPIQQVTEEELADMFQVSLEHMRSSMARGKASHGPPPIQHEGRERTEEEIESALEDSTSLSRTGSPALFNPEAPLEGETFVITGDTPTPREELEQLLTTLGARVTKRISGQTTYLIVGADPGPRKIQEAKAQPHIKVMDESALHVLLGRLPKLEGQTVEEYYHAHPPPPPTLAQVRSALRKEAWRHTWRTRTNPRVSPEMRASHPSIEGFTAKDLCEGGAGDGGASGQR